ncbi:hypothetical protein D3C71_2114580 [compost metagenome]
MYSAMSEGMPAKNIEFSSSTSTPCEIAEVAITDLRTFESGVNGRPGSSRVWAA